MSEQPTHESLRTRWSLLSRLKDWEDRESWGEFFDTYRDLIFNVARKAGLNAAEADEVVQETVITVAKKMPEFKTDSSAGSFKGWLLHTTRWKINDQFRKRKPDQKGRARPLDELTTQTATIERVPDTAALAPQDLWDAEWRQNLYQQALKGVEDATRAKHFQVFHLSVVEELPAKEVAHRTGINIMHVYRLKHRLGGMLKKEIKRLEKELGS